MCPLCDERCDFWYYRDTCNAAHVLFLFDNGGTVFFAAFMSLWGKYAHVTSCRYDHVNVIYQLFYSWNFGKDDSLYFNMTGMYWDMKKQRYSNQIVFH